MARLLQLGVILPEALEHKYKNEIFANEFVLLSYYIASINIEQVYHQVRAEQGADEGYVKFPGMTLTDTFQLHEGDGTITEDFEGLAANNERAKAEKDSAITVIVMNPPYSSVQNSANDNNQNLAYPRLDERIAATYAAKSTGVNKNSLYDSYFRALRWASDRIGQRGVAGGFVGELDIMDTWATSSLSPQLACGWLDDEDLFARTYPMDLRPQGQDIIRTWLFSTVVRADLEFGALPWKHTGLSGWILDSDHKKMSKSKGNVVTPMGILEKYGSDAVRYWAASAQLGLDAAFDEQQIKIGRRLAIKVLNASKFALTMGGAGDGAAGSFGTGGARLRHRRGLGRVGPCGSGDRHRQRCTPAGPLPAVRDGRGVELVPRGLRAHRPVAGFLGSGGCPGRSLGTRGRVLCPDRAASREVRGEGVAAYAIPGGDRAHPEGSGRGPGVREGRPRGRIQGCGCPDRGRLRRR